MNSQLASALSLNIVVFVCFLVFTALYIGLFKMGFFSKGHFLFNLFSSLILSYQVISNLLVSQFIENSKLAPKCMLAPVVGLGSAISVTLK